MVVDVVVGGSNLEIRSLTLPTVARQGSTTTDRRTKRGILNLKVGRMGTNAQKRRQVTRTYETYTHIDSHIIYSVITTGPPGPLVSHSLYLPTPSTLSQCSESRSW